MTAASLDTSVIEQAARWIIELEDADEPALLAEFSGWLKASPQNVEAYLSAAAAWDACDGIDGQRTVDIDRWLVESGGNVVPLGAKIMLPTTRPVPLHRRKLWIAAACAALTVALALVFALAPRTFSTGVGAQRTIKLADGSVVYLNAGSRLQVHFTDRRRNLRLLEGEALFVVQKEPQRPFIVHAGATAIEAIGTRFNVYQREGGTKVSVIEGEVRVADAPLVAGEQASITPQGAVTKRALPDISEAVAWRDRRLIFRDEPLANIVAEFNRYNADYRLRFEGGADEQPRLTGVFRADDPQALLLFLQVNSDLTVERGERAALIHR